MKFVKICVVSMFLFNASVHAKHSDDLQSTDNGVRIWSQYKTPEGLIRAKANQNINEALIKLKSISAHKKLNPDNKIVEVYGSYKYFGAISYIIIRNPFRSPYDIREVEPPPDTAIENIGKWFRFLQQNEHLLGVKLPATLKDSDILESEKLGRKEYKINGSIVKVMLDDNQFFELKSTVTFRSRSDIFDGTWDIYLFESSNEIFEDQMKEKILAKSKISIADIHKHFLNKRLDTNKYLQRMSNEIINHPWYCGDRTRLSEADCHKKMAREIADTKDTIELYKPIFLSANDIKIAFVRRSHMSSVNGNDFSLLYFNYQLNLADRITIEIDSYTGLTNFVDYCATNGSVSGVEQREDEKKKILFTEIKTSCD